MAKTPTPGGFLEIASIQTEADAYRYLEGLRWPDGPVCPHCGNAEKHYYLKPKNEDETGGQGSRKTRTGNVSARRVWRCAACRRQFSVLTGTVFHGSKVPLKTWLMVAYEMCANKNGIAAAEIQRKYKVGNKTAWFMAHRLREGMKVGAPTHLLTGTIVADETYIGGDPKRMNRKTRARWEGKDAEPERVVPGGARPNQLTAKTPVLSLINAETGEVRSAVVANVDGRTLRKVIAEQVDIDHSHLQTDEGPWYWPVGREFLSHLAVNHNEEQYVGPTGESTNMAENYFSQLKRSIDGTHHHISVEHLPRYLAEFDFRYSTCKKTDEARVARLMGQVAGRRLSYKRVKGNL